MEIMKQEMCNPSHIPAHIIQVTEKEQFVYIEGDVCEVTGVEIHMADGCNDPFLKKEKKTKPKSSVILPGSVSQVVPLITTKQQAAVNTSPISFEDVHIVDITFRTNEVKNQQLVDKVKKIAWNHGI